MVLAACVYDSIRGEVGGVLVFAGAVASWLTYRGTPLKRAGMTRWTAACLVVMVVGFILWVPVCLEEQFG